MPMYNVAKRRGKAKIKISAKREAAMKRLAGEKHSRAGNNARWGHQNGSVYLWDQKFPIKIPRVRNVDLNQEVPLETYRRLQIPFDDDRGALLRLLHGLSTHKYHESVSLATEAFGISASNLSKRYADDGLMVALGVTIDGHKIVLGIEQSHSENAKAIEQWFDRLIERGLKYYYIAYHDNK